MVLRSGFFKVSASIIVRQAKYSLLSPGLSGLGSLISINRYTIEGF